MVYYVEVFQSSDFVKCVIWRSYQSANVTASVTVNGWVWNNGGMILTEENRNNGGGEDTCNLWKIMSCEDVNCSVLVHVL